MISHFLGVSQTLILKGGHTGSTFSKILGNSHWLSPESGFSQDASTPLLPKLWGKSLFATQEWGGGGGLPYMSYTGMCQTMLPSSFHHWARQKRSIPILTIVVWNRVTNSVCLEKVESVKDSAHYHHRVPPGVPQHRDTLAITDRKIYTCIQRDTTPILPLSLPDQGCLWNRSKILKSLFHARL